jgi:hypothetical protein
MENCVFIDIFTTQNDLYGKNNCPIQFCCEVFTNEELFDYEKLFNPERRKIFNIIPDEEISIPGFINSGFKTEDIKTSDFNGVELVEALNTIYKLLSTFKNRNFYIIGYNHIRYDIEILNAHFKRILNLEPIVFDEHHVIDLMKVAENKISIDKIWSYSMESVLTYLTKDCNMYKSLRTNRTTATDIKITKMIFKEFFYEYMSLSEISEKSGEIQNVDILNFGKYKGAKIDYVFENDKQYCSWLTKNKDIIKQNKKLIEKIISMYNIVQ